MSITRIAYPFLIRIRHLGYFYLIKSDNGRVPDYNFGRLEYVLLYNGQWPRLEGNLNLTWMILAYFTTYIEITFILLSLMLS